LNVHRDHRKLNDYLLMCLFISFNHLHQYSSNIIFRILAIALFVFIEIMITFTTTMRIF